MDVLGIHLISNKVMATMKRFFFIAGVAILWAGGCGGGTSLNVPSGNLTDIRDLGFLLYCTLPELLPELREDCLRFADLDQSGVVDGKDYELLMARLLLSDALGAEADLDGDGQVDEDDYSVTKVCSIVSKSFSTGPCLRADLDRSGDVTESDVRIVVRQYEPGRKSVSGDFNGDGEVNRFDGLLKGACADVSSPPGRFHPCRKVQVNPATLD